MVLKTAAGIHYIIYGVENSCRHSLYNIWCWKQLQASYNDAQTYRLFWHDNCSNKLFIYIIDGWQLGLIYNIYHLETDFTFTCGHDYIFAEQLFSVPWSIDNVDTIVTRRRHIGWPCFIIQNIQSTSRATGFVPANYILVFYCLPHKMFDTDLYNSSNPFFFFGRGLFCFFVLR